MRRGARLAAAVAGLGLGISTLAATPVQAREYSDTAQRYLTVACTTNALRTWFFQAYESEDYTISELRKMSRIVAAGSWKAAKKLDRMVLDPAIQWREGLPSSAVTDWMQGVIRNELTFNQIFNGFATAKTRKILTERIEAARFPTNTDAQFVRLRLGLPPAGAKNNGCPSG